MTHAPISTMAGPRGGIRGTDGAAVGTECRSCERCRQPMRSAQAEVREITGLRFHRECWNNHVRAFRSTHVGTGATLPGMPAMHGLHGLHGLHDVARVRRLPTASRWDRPDSPDAA